MSFVLKYHFLPVDEAFSLITSSGSDIFNLNSGKIEVGRDADLILVDLTHPSLIPNHNLISNMVYSANGSVVDTTICQGKVLMENRTIPGSDLIIDNAVKSAKRLFQS